MVAKAMFNGKDVTNLPKNAELKSSGTNEENGFDY